MHAQASPESTRPTGGSLCAEREKTKAKHLLVFQHQPWFLEEYDENDNYFNIPKERRMPMLEEMEKAGVLYIALFSLRHLLKPPTRSRQCLQATIIATLTEP